LSYILNFKNLRLNKLNTSELNFSPISQAIKKLKEIPALLPAGQLPFSIPAILRLLMLHLLARIQEGLIKGEIKNWFTCLNFC